MRRITISLEDDLAQLAQSEVRAGRASSISAWVADAIRAKARARNDLVSDLEDLERREPTPEHLVSSMARVLGLSKTAVAQALKARPSKRARGRSAA